MSEEKVTVHVRPIITVFALVATAFVAVGNPAWAASEDIAVRTPDVHQQLKRSPSEVVIVLNRDVDPGLAKIVVRNSAGKNVTQGTIQIEGTNMVMPLAFDLPKDTYTVWWRGNRADGEAVGGAWQFSYGKGSWTDVPNSSWSGNANEPGEMASTDPNGEPTTAAPTSETPTASASPTSASPTAEVTPTPTAPASTGAPATGGDGVNGWLIGGVVAVVVAAGAGTAVVLRKRRDQSD